jgi:hypothetical protein
MPQDEFDQRQYRTMLDMLIAFERGEIRLDALVGSLEALLNLLNNKEQAWTQKFQSAWGVLEDVRAFALFKNIKSFDERTDQLLRSTVNNLKLMVLEEIKDPADKPRMP